MKIDILIWSKNRACQLDLLLRSIKENFYNHNKVYVRYDYSNEEFERGFQKLMAKDYDLSIIYVKSSDLGTDTKNIIFNKFETDYMINLCDDEVFIRPTNIDEIVGEDKEDVCAISLRMSKYVTHCYSTNRPSPLPKFIPCGKFLKWKWEDSSIYTDWGYPASVNSHIYNTQWFRQIIKNYNFLTPNKLESLLLADRELFNLYIVSFKESHTINISVNRVQNLVLTNRFGTEFSYTCKELNDRWLNGEVIDTKNIYGGEENQIFKEVELCFIKEKK